MFSRICLNVQSSSYMTALWTVPVEAARRIVPDDYFRVAEIFPDQAVFFVGTGEFRQADIGPYHELYVGFYTENRESGEPATVESNKAEFERNASKMYMWKNWVTTDVALERMNQAGSTVFRKGAIERMDTDDQAVFAMQHESEGSVRLSAPLESALSQNDFAMQRTHYGRLHGEPSRCILDLQIDSMATSPGGGVLVLEGEIARQCEALELAPAPLVSIWIDEMHFAMHKPLRLPAA